MNESKPPVEPNPLTSKDVAKVGKDIVRTAVIWTFAGMLTQFARDAIKKVTGK